MEEKNPVKEEKKNLPVIKVCCFIIKPTNWRLVFGEIMYRKVPKFSDTRKLCCKKPKIQEKRPDLWVSRQKDANGIANSGDPDQTVPLGAV